MPRGRSHVIRHTGLFSPLQPGDLVWAYLRHSPGEDQDIRSQREVVERFCRERQLVVLRWWIDEALSGGAVAGRDQFEAMVQASRQSPPPVAGIVVRDLGRLSRDDLESQFYMADLRLRGYRIVSVFDDIPQGEFAPIFESFIRWKNARFLRDLQANVLSGIDATVHARYVIDGVERTGFSSGGFPPVGYEARRVQVGTKKSGKPLIAVYWVKTTDPDLRARVQRAWDMAVQAARAGEMVRISQVHRETGILRPASYYDFYRHITYAGVRKVGDRQVEGAHEAYVSLPDWHLVQTYVAKRKPVSLRQRPRRDGSPFHLAGRAFCGYCGSPIWLEGDPRTNGFQRLRCSRRQKSGGSCCLASVSYRPFLASLIEKLKVELLTVERVEAAIAEMNRQRAGSMEQVARERQRLIKEIAAVQRSVDRLVDAIEAGHSASVRDRLMAREAELAELRARLASVTAEERAHKPLWASRAAIEAVIDALVESLESDDPEALKAALGAIIRRVDLYNDRAEVSCTHDPAVVLLWPNRGYDRCPQGETHRTPDVRLQLAIVRRYRSRRSSS